MRRLVTIGLVVSAGCAAPELGDCDESAAYEVVYDPQGNPAFVGQAMMLRHCAGGFCHSDEIPVANRFGVPVGLELDVAIATNDESAATGATERLVRNHQRVRSWSRGILAQVDLGTMPPGEIAETLLTDAVRYDRLVPGLGAGEPLPEISDAAGREELRNWLACGAPVVERTRPRADHRPNAIGFTEAAFERRPPEPTWESIYERVIVVGCTQGACHDAVQPEVGLDLVTGGADGVLARLLESSAMHEASACAGEALLVAGDSSASLMYTKLTSDELGCGGRMPLARAPLSPASLAAVRECIDAGAL